MVLAVLSNVHAQTAIEPVYNTDKYTVAITDAPARVEIPNMTNLTAADDGIHYIPMGFQFVFFNRTFNSVNASTNGNFQFQTAVTTSNNAFFGVSSDYSPAIAFFHTDLNPNFAGARQWAVTGTAPNRELHVVYNNVRYYSAGVNDTGLIGEIVLYETSNIIDMRWYQIPILISTTIRNVEIGIQDVARNTGANHLADWVALWNDRNFSSTTAPLFTGKQARFTPLNSVPAGTPAPPTICTGTPIWGSASYNIEMGTAPAMPALPGAVNITSGDDRIDYVVMPFTFTFYNRTFNSVNVSSNGNAQFLTAQTGSTNSFFLAAGSNPTYAPAVALFHTDLNPNFAGGRQWAVLGAAPSRQFIVRFNSVPYYGSTVTPYLLADLIFEEGTNQVVMNYYTVPTGTRTVEIGVQNSGDQSDWLAYWNDAAISPLCAEGLTGLQLRFIPNGQAGYVPPPTPSSTGSVITPSSSTGVAPSSTGPVVTPSSSTGPVTNPSSSTGPVTNPSSSSAAPTAAPQPTATPTPTPVIPDGSVQVVMNVQLPGPVTEENFASTAAALERDIARILSTPLGASFESLAQYIRVLSIGSVSRPAAARRLLQAETPVTFVILSSVSEVVSGEDVATVAANTVAEQIRRGDFQPTESAITVPAQSPQVTPVQNGGNDDDLNGSASVNSLLALVVVAISMVFAL